VFFRVERWRGFTSSIQIGMERVEYLAEEHLAGIGPHLRMGVTSSGTTIWRSSAGFFT